jgi:hypothetical protein
MPEGPGQIIASGAFCIRDQTGSHSVSDSFSHPETISYSIQDSCFSAPGPGLPSQGFRAGAAGNGLKLEGGSVLPEDIHFSGCIVRLYGNERYNKNRS